MKTFRFICLSMAIFLVSCMAKVENEDIIDNIEITSHEIERVGPNAQIILHGICPKYTDTLKINVESSGYDVVPSSMSNPSAWSEGSGVPIGECANGVLTVKYPVPNPSHGRIISFKLKAKMPDGKISLYAALRDVDYSIPAENLPGFAVTSGGAFEGSGGLTIHGSAGIAYGKVGNIIIVGTNVKLREGLQAILYDDSF